MLLLRHRVAATADAPEDVTHSEWEWHAGQWQGPVSGTERAEGRRKACNIRRSKQENRE